MSKPLCQWWDVNPDKSAVVGLVERRCPNHLACNRMQGLNHHRKTLGSQIQVCSWKSFHFASAIALSNAASTSACVRPGESFQAISILCRESPIADFIALQASS